ncbi:outer membrane protein assembly factor BamB family protein [Spirosoma aerolatum]|uniref:outer membrane protein assembly factor BamB family protein n=1 Tax=Spirosoma aerolatum TaxID=1211326 RepID=UPI0009ACDDF1|nr:PQQ-binding-like beta-propeller repeat protein [Spirosoma aerolatum]
MKSSFPLLSTLFCLLLLWVTSCKKTEDTPSPGGGTTTPTTKSSAKSITTFAFNALSPVVNATIDATAKTISATVAAGTDVTKLVPTITISDKVTVSPASGAVQDFSKSVTYTVTAEDGSTQAYTVYVIVASAGNAGVTGNNLIYLYVATSATDNSTGKLNFHYYIKAYNITTGQEAGSISLGSRKEGDGTYESAYAAYPEVYNNGVLFAASEGKMSALDVATGKTKWTTSLSYYSPGSSNGETRHTVDGGVLFATGSSSKTIFALSEADGSTKWTFEHTDNINTLTAINGVLYVGYGDANYSGGLLAIDVSTGKQKWAIKSIGVYSNPAVVNDVVYYGDYKNKVFAVEAATGTKKWEFAAAGAVTGSPTITDGIVYISSEDRKIYALDAATGTKKWDFTAPGKYGISLTGDASTLYAVAYNNSKWTFYALDKKTGTKKWEATPSTSTNETTPVAAGGMLYYGTLALEAATGAEKNLGFKGTSPCVVISGKYVGSNTSGLMQ